MTRLTRHAVSTGHSKPPDSAPNLDVPKRYRLPQLKGHSVFEITIPELQRHFSDGHFTSVEYVSHCLEYIRVMNPYLEAVIETNPDALNIAKELDEQRRQGKLRGPLHGIPVLVKDNMATKDSMQTTAGSWSLLGSIVPRDCFVVTKLRQAGAVILGHSNMGEWASLRSKQYSTGYSPRGGQVRNPFDLSRSPLGSSSGSAVAVSANLCPLSLGTETDSSIIGPAGINGVVGIKPTVGLTSRSGVIPISENMDSVGPFARTVADAVTVLDAVAGGDEEDLFTLSSGVPRAQQRYLDFISTREALKGAKFGLPLKRCWDLVPPDCKPVMCRLFTAMRRAGAEIVGVDFPSVDERVSPAGEWDWEHGEPSKSEWTVVKVDAYNGISSYLASLVGSPVRTVEEVVKYNYENTGTEGGRPGDIPAFPDGQAGFLEVLASRGVKDDTYHAALEHTRRQTREKGIDAALSFTEEVSGKTVKLDALLLCDRNGIGQQYAAQAGYPIISLPIGLDGEGLPISLSLQHSAWEEATLVKWASAIEDLWQGENGSRVTPGFRNLHAKNIPVLS